LFSFYTSNFPAEENFWKWFFSITTTEPGDIFSQISFFYFFNCINRNNLWSSDCFKLVISSGNYNQFVRLTSNRRVIGTDLIHCFLRFDESFFIMNSQFVIILCGLYFVLFIDWIKFVLTFEVFIVLHLFY
jgi:hypothetical protein